jgi:hypothetical protein
MRHNASVVERGIEPAKFGNGVIHHSRHLGVVTHVAAGGDCLVTSGNQLLRGCRDGPSSNGSITSRRPRSILNPNCAYF